MRYALVLEASCVAMYVFLTNFEFFIIFAYSAYLFKLSSDHGLSIESSEQQLRLSEQLSAQWSFEK